MNRQLLVALCVLLFLTAGCLGGVSDPTATPDSTTTSDERTPPADLRDRERQLLEQSFSLSLQTTNWTTVAPDATPTAWETNRTARALAAHLWGSYASVETICYDANAEQAVLRVTLTDEATVSGYDSFTVSTNVTVVPAVPNDPSAPPVGTVVTENAYKCDRVVESPVESLVAPESVEHAAELAHSPSTHSRMHDSLQR